MEKDVVPRALTTMEIKSPLTTPPVYMTIPLHVQLEYVHQVYFLLATNMCHFYVRYKSA